MKTFVLLCGSFLFLCVVGFGQNMIRDFEAENPKLLPEFKLVESPLGSLTQFTEDLTWNKCLKLEIQKYNIDPATQAKSVNFGVMIGGDSDGDGFPCKPDTTYSFSVEIKGVAKRAMINYFEWDSLPTSFKNRKKLRAPMHLFHPQKEWTTYKGTFKTTSTAKRAALEIQFWGDEKSKDLEEKIGDYLLIDKIRIEEAEASVVTSSSTAMETPAKVRKVYLAPCGKDTVDETVWAKTPGASGFQLANSEKMASTQTEIKAVAGADAFYLKIKCHEPEMSKIRGDTHKDVTTADIWKDDLVEIFFDAVASDRILNQFVVSAGGGRWMGNGAGPLDKFSAWEAKVSKEKNFWAVDVKIPYSTLGCDGNPGAGTLLKFNVCRQRLVTNELSAFSFPDGNFHDKSKFAAMFVESIAPYAEKELAKAKEFKDIPPIAKLIGGIDLNKPAEAYAKLEQLAEQLRLVKLGRQKFILAKIPPSTDTAIPFLPRELNTPGESFKIRAAVNEFAPLVLALANMTSDWEEYRVQLCWGLEYENDTMHTKYDAPGLKSEDGTVFPMDKISMRRGVPSKDANTQQHGKRYDILAKLNQASTVPVPARGAGLLWLTFDCRGVKPGIYRGHLNLIPLSEVCESFKYLREKDIFEIKGNFKKYPVELEVLPITLPEESPMPAWNFRFANNEAVFMFMREYDNILFHVTPWWFNFKFNSDGTVAEHSVHKNLIPLIKMQVGAIRKSGMKTNPKLAIAYGAYLVFKNTHRTTHGKKIEFNTEAYWNAWRNWVKGVEKVMTDNGVKHEEYAIEVFDEPQFASPEIEAEYIRAFAEAKKASPKTPLVITNGHPSPAGCEELAKHIDYWIFGLYHIGGDQKELSSKIASLPGKRTGVYACGTSLKQDLYRYYRLLPWLGLSHKTYIAGIYNFFNEGGDENSPVYGYGASDFYVPAWGGLAYMSGCDNPIPSARLEAFRIGQTDIKYMKLLENLATNCKNEKLKAEAKQLLEKSPADVSMTFQHDTTKADEARNMAIELILKIQQQEKQTTSRETQR